MPGLQLSSFLGYLGKNNREGGKITLPPPRLGLKSNFFKAALVSAKSRVSLLRQITTPRLALLGNLLLSRLMSIVINNLTSVYSIDKMFGWTDSSIADALIQNINKVYKSFID